MRIAYLILAHKNPEQIQRLVTQLDHPNADIYIHLDKKVNIEGFRAIEQSRNVIFIKRRTEVNWGGNSTLMAIVQSLLEIKQVNSNYAFINLLSGQDYPLMNAQHIYEFLNENKGYNFISYDESKDSVWWQAASARYRRYHFTDLPIKGKYVLQRLVSWLLPSRKIPGDLQLYGSAKSAWWTITGDCANYVASEITSNTKLQRFLKYCWGTDEFAVASLIMNSEFRNKTINNNLRYIDWSEGNPRPKLLTSEDIPSLDQSRSLFARKFDINIDGAVLDYISCNLLTREKSL